MTPQRRCHSFAVVWVALAPAACGGSNTAPTPPTDAPQIACPAAPGPVESLDGSAQVVSFPAPTVTGGQAPLNTTCLPVSGASFPIGSNTVTCTTSDAHARTASCTFPVVVEPPPVLSVKSFIAFGDSITYGEDGRNTARVNAVGRHVHVQLVGQTYPEVLLAELQTRYRQQQVSVTNAGCPGEELGTPGDFDEMRNCQGIRADDPSALARFTSIVSLHQYEVALLMEGSNDVNDAQDDSNAIPTAVGKLQAMIEVAKANGMKVILATIPPMLPPGDPTRTVGASFVPSYNDHIRGLATSEGVPLADIYAAFGSDAPTLIGFDGLHPDPDGYKRVADTFLAAIKNSLETNQPTAARTFRRVR